VSELRFKLPPGGDVPPVTAARRMGMTLEAFTAKLPDLRQRGFPAPDATTGNFDLDAIDQWRKARNPQLFGQPTLTPQPGARNASDVVSRRLKEIRGGG
jgi:hypothetical protein